MIATKAFLFRNCSVLGKSTVRFMAISPRQLYWIHITDSTLPHRHGSISAYCATARRADTRAGVADSFAGM